MNSEHHFSANVHAFARCPCNTMNRPRNRQQRPPREHDRGGRRGPQNASGSSVPTLQQVRQGAFVSIVLKQDQPTGREVQGTVQDLLTRGDHPRGIKVRLTDGRVGRVQRMAIANSASSASLQQQQPPPSNVTAWPGLREAPGDDYQNGPPPRSLADFLPVPESDRDNPPVTAPAIFASANARCPICNLFEGDEIAVSRHVEDHFT
jgi:uncharacterized repeat protein (TIGR03833 family)